MLTLTCRRDELLNALSIVNKAVSNRTTIPILECVLLTASEIGLVLTGNDLELGIQSAPIPAQIKRDGTVALESRIFTEIIRKMDGEEVYLSVNDANMTLIQCGSSKFQIPGQNGLEFPGLPDVSKNQCYTLAQSDLKDMIRQTIFSIAQDDSKPVLTGELFELTEGELAIVSVDGYRISYRKGSLEKGHSPASIIIPGKTLSELNKILIAEEDTAVSIYVTDKHVLFETQYCLVVSRLIEGDFIKYAQSFPDEFKTQITVNRLELIQSLDRASLFSRESKKTPVKLDIASPCMKITANSELGQAEENVTVELDGVDLTIAFNPKYLIDALRAIEEEQILLEFNTPLSPCTIKPLSGSAFLYLVLPLRL